MANTIERSAATKEIKELCALDSRLNLGFVLLEWSSIFFAIYCSQRFFNPLVYACAVIWIGSRLHAIGILMHEAAHYRLFKSRKVNEFIGEVVLAWPLTMTLRGYRNSHLAHHQNLNTPDDPDWEDGSPSSRDDYKFPKSKLGMTWALARNIIGLGFYDEFTDTAQTDEFNDIPKALRVSQIASYVLIVLASIAFGFWKLLLLYWLVPVATTLIFFAYVRAIAEHYALDWSTEYSKSRTTLATLWEGILLAPYHVGYHLDHHLHPGVPWYNLPKLHAELMKDPVYASKAHITKSGYFKGFINECLTFTNGRIEP